MIQSALVVLRCTSINEYHLKEISNSGPVMNRSSETWNCTENMAAGVYIAKLKVSTAIEYLTFALKITGQNQVIVRTCIVRQTSVFVVVTFQRTVSP